MTAPDNGDREKNPEVPAIDWVLVVQERSVGAEKTLHYSLNTRERPLEDLGIVTLKRDLQQFFKEFFQEIDRLPATDVESREDILQSMGNHLAQLILTKELMQRLYELRATTRTAQIITDEAVIPWEFVRVQKVDRSDGFFLCETFSLTRWRRGAENRPWLPLMNPALVTIKSPDLKAIDEEVSGIEKLLDEAKRKPSHIPPQFREITKNMESGAFGCWHFMGHGRLDKDDPDRWFIPLSDGIPLTPRRLQGRAANLGRYQAPLVFLNCCHSGKGGQSLTKIGGWADQFLDLGAGAFVGSSWSATDEPAKDFAILLYREFLKGVPIGEAALGARLAIHKKYPGDPTWLAYTVFAHPSAIFAEKPDEASIPPLPDIPELELPDDGSTVGSAARRGDMGSIPFDAASWDEQPWNPKHWSPKQQQVAGIGGVAALILVMVVSMILPGSGGAPGTPDGTDPLATTTATPPPPPLPENEPIQTGLVGVGAVDMESYEWDAQIAQILKNNLGELHGDLKFKILPDGFRPRIEGLLDGDHSMLPGGEVSPGGFEYLFLVAQSHRDNPRSRSSFPSVTVSCNVTAIDTRKSESIFSGSFSHNGNKATENAALDQAFGYCIEDSATAIP